MTSRTLRRRLHHGDVDGRRHEHMETSEVDSLNEPLLGNREEDDVKSFEDYTHDAVFDEGQSKEHLHWALLFSQLIAQWAQWLANIVLGSGSFIGRLFPFIFAPQDRLRQRISPPLLSPLQEARLKYLKQRLAVPFDGSFLTHQDALRQLWRLSYPDRELPALKSELWKEMGWQGTDPSTDFRGGGFISLENMIFFAKTYPVAFQDLLHKRVGNRSEWEYPFAVAGINISFMLVQMLDLQSASHLIYKVLLLESNDNTFPSCERVVAMQLREEDVISSESDLQQVLRLPGTPSTSAGLHFLELLTEDDMAFDNLFCVAFQLMDAQWLAKRASYMEFNDVLKSTRTQLERELSLEDITRIRDLPAYNLLRR